MSRRRWSASLIPLLVVALTGLLCVLAYENLEITEPRPAVVQRIAARNATGPLSNAAAVTMSE